MSYQKVNQRDISSLNLSNGFIQITIHDQMMFN